MRPQEPDQQWRKQSHNQSPSGEPGNKQAKGIWQEMIDISGPISFLASEPSQPSHLAKHPSHPSEMHNISLSNLPASLYQPLQNPL